MLAIKGSVDARGLKPEALLGVMVAAEIFAKAGFDCVVTSITDSKHIATSLHGLGYAADFRTKHLPNPGVAAGIVRDLKAALSPQYQVVLEPDHIHVEFDPRALLAQ